MTHDLRMPPTAKAFDRRFAAFEFDPPYDVCLMTYRGPRPMGPRARKLEALETTIRVTTHDKRVLELTNYILFARDDINHRIMVRCIAPHEITRVTNLQESEGFLAKAPRSSLPS